MADSAVVENLSPPSTSQLNNLNVQPLISISENQVENEKMDEMKEPDTKRKKVENPQSAGEKKISESFEKLEFRLGGILSCAVCLDLPRTAMFQVIFYFKKQFFFFLFDLGSPSLMSLKVMRSLFLT